MNRNQGEGHANETRGKVKKVADKVTTETSTESRGKPEKHGKKGGAVLGEINSEPGDEKK